MESVTFQGNFKSLSTDLNNVKWQIINQTRSHDDSPCGQQLTENLLFSQIGYQMNNNASFWFGYIHDWISPLTGLPTILGIAADNYCKPAILCRLLKD